MGLPWRVAFALQEDGWILRSKITWAKKSAMPESVKNRPINATEEVFLFAKSINYFYNAAGFREESGANARNFWLLGPDPGNSGHPATFPRELVRRCLLLGSRVGDIVLDPFGGSGTTAIAAQELDRNTVLIEINPEYAEISRARLKSKTNSTEAGRAISSMSKDKPAKSPGSRQLILECFLSNLGRVVESKDIQKTSGGAVEWARRVRELRNELGYQILSHKDRANLKPNQYLLETDKRVPAFARDISKETRAWVLERNVYSCQMCGLAAGGVDPFDPQMKVRLTMGHIIDKSKGGADTPNNLRAICSNCNEGLQNSSPPKPDRIYLLSQIRRATVDDQLVVLTWLKNKFAQSQT